MHTDHLIDHEKHYRPTKPWHIAQFVSIYVISAAVFGLMVTRVHRIIAPPFFSDLGLEWTVFVGSTFDLAPLTTLLIAGAVKGGTIGLVIGVAHLRMHNFRSWHTMPRGLFELQLKRVLALALFAYMLSGFFSRFFYMIDVSALPAGVAVGTFHVLTCSWIVISPIGAAVGASLGWVGNRLVLSRDYEYGRSSS